MHTWEPVVRTHKYYAYYGSNQRLWARLHTKASDNKAEAFKIRIEHPKHVSVTLTNESGIEDGVLKSTVKMNSQTVAILFCNLCVVAMMMMMS